MHTAVDCMHGNHTRQLHSSATLLLSTGTATTAVSPDVCVPGPQTEWSHRTPLHQSPGHSTY